MAERFRPSVQPTVSRKKSPTGGTRRECDAKKAKIIADAKREAAKIRKNALAGVIEREQAVDAKVKVINRLLPKGFEPAPNLDILPPEIRRKAEMTAAEAMAGVSVHDAFMPTPLQRSIVYDYAKFGVPLPDICLRVVNPLTERPITVDTLKKYFYDEINLGRSERNIQIAHAGFRMATYQPAVYDEDGNEVQAEKEPNPSVLISALKHDLKWLDRKEVTHTNNAGVEPELAEALKQLTADELRIIRGVARQRIDEKTEGSSSGDR